MPSIKDWPIYKIYKNRHNFIDEISRETYKGILENMGGKTLKDVIETTIYKEKSRVKNMPWRVDPKGEADYWRNTHSRLIRSESLETPLNEQKNILNDIVHRYAEEITGNFKISYYLFAKFFVTFGFARLLNAARVKGLLSLFSRQLDLDDKINIVGEIEHIRSLTQKGTVVMVPTHFSNLDSILIAWVIQFIGLPAFIYGAGLNLYNIGIISFFISKLGAYKLDRRKKNPIYLETLKIYSIRSLWHGCHTLFFPGGARSRSGEVEKTLKLGLLNSIIESQRQFYQKPESENRKIFIVPTVINYQFTLEAPALIREHLKKTGRERFYEEFDEFSNSYKIASFMLKFITKGSNVSVSIGRGMDILGNYVDMKGNSLDQNGNILDVKDYFRSNDEIVFDKQRENAYIRILSKRIIEEYHTYSQLMPSHLIAYTAFKMLEKKNKDMDLYHLLRISDEDMILDPLEFENKFENLRSKVLELNECGKVGVNELLKGNKKEAIADGFYNIGLYHAKRPIVKKNNKVIVQDMNTLYYYHNRMNGFGLEDF